MTTPRINANKPPERIIMLTAICTNLLQNRMATAKKHKTGNVSKNV
jgi:hypothetical protein